MKDFCIFARRLNNHTSYLIHHTSYINFTLQYIKEMSHKIGVLIIHGIGNQMPSYANNFIKDIQAKLEHFEINPEFVKIVPATWSHEVQAAEEELWRNVTQKDPLNFNKLRKFMISYFGDAVAYAGTPNKSNGMYYKIHENLHETIQKLRVDLGGADN